MISNFLIESPDYTVVSNEIKSIINKQKFMNATISNYDLEEQELTIALEDLDTYSFLSDKKVIIIKNVFSNYNEKNFSYLLKYINNPNPDNLLFLVCSKLDNRLNCVKQLKNNKNLEILNINIDPFKYTKDLLKDYKINNKDINILLEKCKNDINKIKNECEKLMIYNIDNHEITSTDIDNLVVKKLGESNEVLFSFIKYILIKNKKMTIQKYQELIEYNIDSFSIIGLLTSQLRMIYQTKLLTDNNLSIEEIAKKLSLKSTYQVKKMIEYGYNYSYTELSNLITSIFELDFKMKSGKIDSSIAFDMFILNI